MSDCKKKKQFHREKVKEPELVKAINLLLADGWDVDYEEKEEGDETIGKHSTFIVTAFRKVCACPPKSRRKSS